MLYNDTRYAELYLERGEELYLSQIVHKKNRFEHLTIKNGNNLRTAYGYGGFRTTTYDPAFIYYALQEYEDNCRKQDIYKDVIKWHPDNDLVNYSMFSEINTKKKLAVHDLKKPHEYNQTTRNILNKDVKVYQTDDIDGFIKMYYGTMDYIKASEFYYFNRAYFEKLMRLPKVEMYCVEKDGKPISMGIFFLDKYASYHLSGNTREHNGTYHLLDYAIKRCKKNKCNKLLLGGGTTSMPDDTLMQFKMKFANDVADYTVTTDYYNKMEVGDEYRTSIKLD